MPEKSRVIRVFLSSTFRDFAEERDLLVKKVFPELRRLCRERQVELVEVDLRWGITEEEAQQGKVLPICLGEIDRARPYFMGFIGDRYGWVPEGSQYPAGIVEREPWLREHQGGKSVTELEMLHGVLNNPEMAGRAFFYFRDSNYSQGKGGDYLSEDADSASKLEALKDRIRASQFPVVEDYADPQALADKVRTDLRALIEEEYPADEVPDDLTLERMRHEAYSQARRKLYIGGENYFTQLDAAMTTEVSRPVLITGESGTGKSALLANWANAWKGKHQEYEIFMHHLGCGADTADPVYLLTRLIREVARITGDEFKPEIDPEKLLQQVPDCLASASAWSEREGKTFLILLDGLDKFSEVNKLRCLPQYLPLGVKLIVSCLDGDIKEGLLGRLNWSELRVEPLTKYDRNLFIDKYLDRYRKKLNLRQKEALLSFPLSCYPLFLQTVLEELRLFGVHEDLEHRLMALLSLPPTKAKGEPPTVDDVFEHVLSRLEGDFGRDEVQLSMEAIWASRTGLYQDELLAITNLTPVQWAEIQHALDEALYDNSGKICFYHDYLRKAVADRYEISRERRLKLHGRLSEWFSKQPNFFSADYVNPNARKFYELSYQAVASGCGIIQQSIFSDISFLLCGCTAGYTQYLGICLNKLSQSSHSLVLDEWADFFETHGSLISRNPQGISPVLAFFQLAIESGSSHSISAASVSFLSANGYPKGDIYISSLNLTRPSYKWPICNTYTFAIDEVIPLFNGVISLGSNFFATMSKYPSGCADRPREMVELWHATKGFQCRLDERVSWSANSIKAELLRGGVWSRSEIEKISLSGLQYNDSENTSYVKDIELSFDNLLVKITNPELGNRSINVSDFEGVSCRIPAHEDSICGAVKLSQSCFVTIGWDDKIKVWTLNKKVSLSDYMQADCLHSEEPNRYLIGNNSSQVLIWTYRPSVDDYGYDEDLSISLWNCSSGTLENSFKLRSPYPRKVEWYSSKIRVNGDQEFELGFSGSELIGEHTEISLEVDYSNLLRYSKYVYGNDLYVLASTDLSTILVSRDGCVKIVKKLNKDSSKVPHT